MQHQHKGISKAAESLGIDIKEPIFKKAMTEPKGLSPKERFVHEEGGVTSTVRFSGGFVGINRSG